MKTSFNRSFPQRLENTQGNAAKTNRKDTAEDIDSQKDTVNKRTLIYRGKCALCLFIRISNL